ncbi:TrkA family potassium uptake protein [candidate division KSB1 bacterium]|nr:TrkA family potassium uptake protein [candidate division KSB1 bacterium]
MRTIAIIGLSSFGHHLCRYLSEAGTQVLAIDVDEKKIDEIKPFVAKAVLADARDKETLQALGLEDIDVAVVSVGEPIDTSIIITLYLKELGVKEIYAKASSVDHGKILDKIGATEIVFPERDMAKRIAHTLRLSTLLDYISLAEGYSIVEMAPPQSWLGKSLHQLDIRKKYNAQIILIKEVIPSDIVLIPGGEHVVKDSDILVVMGRDKDLEELGKL